MARNTVPVGAPLWMVTFADLMSLLVCFFVMIISFSVPDTEKLRIVAGSMRDAFGFQREMIVTGMVEIDGNPHYKYPRDLLPVPVDITVGPIPGDNDDITDLSRREEAWRQLLDELEADRPQPIASRTEAGSEEDQRFAQIGRDLRQAMQSVRELERLAENLVIERAPEGLRIQIVDQERSSMFPLGSARMYERTRTLLRHVAEAISSLPNKLSITGHTDSLAYRTAGYDNWSLSLDRADATRRMLVASGIEGQRIAAVVGKADTEHVFPDRPLDPRNRRISITLLREQPSPSPSGTRGRGPARGERTPEDPA